MNREIKFRAWKKSWGMMVIPEEIQEFLNDEDGIYGIKWLNETTDGQKHKEEWLYENDGDVCFMQFTGLKDKNGKDIYEGDIIRGARGTGNVVFGKYVTDNEDNDDVLCWAVSDPTTRWYALDPQCTWEVIGNIYENPELLAN